MRWTACALGVVLATAAFAAESEPDTPDEDKAGRASSRTVCTVALRLVGDMPEDFEGSIKVLGSALKRVSDKRYRRLLAHRIDVLRKKGGIPAPKPKDPAEYYEEARELVRSRPDDYVGNVRKLEILAAKAAGTKYEKRIKVLLGMQKQGAEDAGWERNPKWVLVDIEEEVRADPSNHYRNMRKLEGAIRRSPDVPQVESTKKFLAMERANWEEQKADLERKIQSTKELFAELGPEEHAANLRLLEMLEKEAAETPFEGQVADFVASIKGAAEPVEEVEVELSEEEELLRLVADVMTNVASAPDVARESRLAEEEAHREAERERRTEQLAEATKDASTPRELRKAAERAASLPGGRKKAVELYERAISSGDPVDAPLACKGLGRLLAGLPLEVYSRARARKRGPDSWRYALACFEKAVKLDPEAATDELALDEGKLRVELAEHSTEKGEDGPARKERDHAVQILKPLAESKDKSTKNAALKLLGRLEGSK